MVVEPHSSHLNMAKLWESSPIAFPRRSQGSAGLHLSRGTATNCSPTRKATAGMCPWMLSGQKPVLLPVLAQVPPLSILMGMKPPEPFTCEHFQAAPAPSAQAEQGAANLKNTSNFIKSNPNNAPVKTRGGLGCKPRFPEHIPALGAPMCYSVWRR